MTKQEICYTVWHRFEDEKPPVDKYDYSKTRFTDFVVCTVRGDLMFAVYENGRFYMYDPIVFSLADLPSHPLGFTEYSVDITDICFAWTILGLPALLTDPDSLPDE